MGVDGVYELVGASELIAVEQSVKLHRTLEMNAYYQRAIWPVTATAAVFGLAIIEYPSGNPRRILSLVWATVTFSIQAGIHASGIICFDIEDEIFDKSVVVFMTLCCVFNMLLSICFTHWHKKRYYGCIEQFNQVDETLRALGITTDYSKLRREGLVGLISWMIMCILISASDYMSFGESDACLAVAAYLINTSKHVNMLMLMQFWSVLRYAGTRFDYISSALRKFIMDDNTCGSWLRKCETMSVRKVFTPDERATHIIWTVMHVHFQLCEILRDINTAFETQMTLQIGYAYMLVLCYIIFLFRLILTSSVDDKLLTGLEIWFWLIPYLVEIIITNQLCETVGAKAEIVCDTAVQLLRFIDDEKMRKDVSLVVLQTKHRPLRLSCLGLCYFGYNFIYEIFNSIVSTAVIILQMKTGLDS